MVGPEVLCMWSLRVCFVRLGVDWPEDSMEGRVQKCCGVRRKGTPHRNLAEARKGSRWDMKVYREGR